jgi:hypothetical protein
MARQTGTEVDQRERAEIDRLKRLLAHADMIEVIVRQTDLGQERRELVAVYLDRHFDGMTVHHYN